MLLYMCEYCISYIEMKSFLRYNLPCIVQNKGIDYTYNSLREGENYEYS